MVCRDCGYEFETMTCPCGWDDTSVAYGGYALATIDDFSLDIIKTVLCNLDDETTTRSILITGPSGAGKTHLAISLAKWLHISRGLHCNLIDRISSLPSTYDEELRSYTTNFDVLIIDEFNDDFFEIVNRRIRNGRVNICTTNSDPDSLDQRFSWRLNKYLLPLDVTPDKPGKRRNKILQYNKWKDYIAAKDMSNVYDAINNFTSTKLVVTGETGMVSDHYNISETVKQTTIS